MLLNVGSVLLSWNLCVFTDWLESQRMKSELTYWMHKSDAQYNHAHRHSIPGPELDKCLCGLMIVPLKLLQLTVDARCWR